MTEITDEVRRLMKAFEKELAIVKARVDGLEAAVGELEATQFSTTTKLKGKVRFIQGAAYRGNGMVRFGKLKDTLAMAKMYGPRIYDGYNSFQDRSVNGVKDGKSQGTAYHYYRYGTGYGDDSGDAAAGDLSDNTALAATPTSRHPRPVSWRSVRLGQVLRPQTAMAAT